MSLFEKEKTETKESNPEALIKKDDAIKQDDTESLIREKLESGVNAAKEFLPKMVDKAVRASAALSKIVIINNDADDEIAEKLLSKVSKTYDEINEMRMKITGPLDEIKELSMRPEKSISKLASHSDSDYNRVKRLRDVHANAKLEKQRKDRAEAERKRLQGEEIIRLKAEFETRFHANIVDLLVSMESNIVQFFGTLTVENFDEKIKKFDITPRIATKTYESWFAIDYNPALLNEDEFNNFIQSVRAVLTYEGVNKLYVDQAIEKIDHYKAQLPAKKQELIETEELRKKDAEAAEKREKELQEKREKEQQEREAAAEADKAKQSEAVAVQARTAQLDNEFDHVKVVQNQEELKGVRKVRVATLTCEPKQIVEILSKAIYTIFTIPVPNPTLHLKKDKQGIVQAPDENGRPIYEDWVEDILTKFVSTGVNIDGITIDERVKTVQRKK